MAMQPRRGQFANVRVVPSHGRVAVTMDSTTPAARCSHGRVKQTCGEESEVDLDNRLLAVLSGAGLVGLMPQVMKWC